MREFAFCSCFLTFRREENGSLHKIVACDDTWVHHYSSVFKSSNKWRKKGKAVSVKPKRCSSAVKALATLFWDRKGVLQVEPSMQITTTSFFDGFKLTIDVISALDKVYRNPFFLENETIKSVQNNIV